MKVGTRTGRSHQNFGQTRNSEGPIDKSLLISTCVYAHLKEGRNPCTSSKKNSESPCNIYKCSEWRFIRFAEPRVVENCDKSIGPVSGIEP